MKTRIFSMAAAVLATSLILGCGSGETEPSEDLTPEVDQAEIQRQIQEGMKAGGMGDHGKMPEVQTDAPKE